MVIFSGENGISRLKVTDWFTLNRSFAIKNLYFLWLFDTVYFQKLEINSLFDCISWIKNHLRL